MQESLATDLQLNRHKASIIWQGKGGMRWGQLYFKIKTLLKVEDPPQILVTPKSQAFPSVGGILAYQ